MPTSTSAPPSQRSRQSLSRAPVSSPTDATPEADETVRQRRLIRLCRDPQSRLAMPELAYLHSVPNSTRTSKSIATQMKGEGVERGAFDLFWDLGRGGWRGLRIEMKKPTPDHPRGVASPEQKAFAAFYESQSILAVRCITEHEAWGILCWYYALVPTPAFEWRTALPEPLAHCAFPTVHKTRPSSHKTRSTKGAAP